MYEYVFREQLFITRWKELGKLMGVRVFSDVSKGVLKFFPAVEFINCIKIAIFNVK